MLGKSNINEVIVKISFRLSIILSLPIIIPNSINFILSVLYYQSRRQNVHIEQKQQSEFLSFLF